MTAGEDFQLVDCIFDRGHLEREFVTGIGCFVGGKRIGLRDQIHLDNRVPDLIDAGVLFAAGARDRIDDFVQGGCFADDLSE